LKKTISILAALIVAVACYTQEYSYEMTLTNKIVGDNISCWNVDAFENILLSDQSNLTKFNSNGEVLYKISNKSFGVIKQIIPITPMKIVLFSEQQQQICFLDNTLTQVESCIDLDLYQIDLATYTARSGRGDNLWVFDQINSKILLIDLKNPGKILQEIRNLNGLIQQDEIVNMFEFQSELFILDAQNKLNKFDLYGNLLSQENTQYTNGAYSENSLWFFKKNELFLKNEGEFSPLNCFVPFDKIENFRVIDSRFYFQQQNEIQVFNLVKKK
jgi:hypothetical protein